MSNTWSAFWPEKKRCKIQKALKGSAFKALETVHIHDRADGKKHLSVGAYFCYRCPTRRLFRTIPMTVLISKKP